MPAKRFHETREEDKLRYAEYVRSDGTFVQEVLRPDPPTLAALVEQHKAGEITGLVTKSGVAWAEYISIDGFNIHDRLNLEDFDDSNPYTIVELRPGYKVTRGANKLQERRFWAEIGRIENLSVKFGPQVPVNFYGNLDYGLYPGGYGPSAAFSGED